MKKYLKYSVLAACVAFLSLLSGCQTEGLDTDQFSDRNVTLAAIQPNPVMRGGELRIVGSNLQNVTSVLFAGDVTVTSIQTVASGARSEIRVIVPLEGPEVGPVTIVCGDGKKLSTHADLTFTEPIVIDSFTPAEALSGDVITVKGEYLNNVKEVIFGGEVYVTEFISQSRHELSVRVPSNAISGYMILGDVDEIADPNTIPNKIYTSEELVVADPTVDTFEPATFKAGDQITITGKHLDMIKSVTLPRAGAVEFNMAEDGTGISFTLPAAASDGEVVLISFAGNEFVAGEIETTFVADVKVSSLAEDGRYKADTDVKITGEDLDLVTKVDFTGAEAEWYYSDGDIIATVPAGAQDGSVTLTLGSGKEYWTDPIEVVKPDVLAWESVESVVAGKGSLFIEGFDLDLVTSAKIGNKKEGFVDCPFEISYDDEDFPVVTVHFPFEAYTGPITLTSAAGYETSTYDIVVIYDEAISVKFTELEVGLGNPINITGSNLLLVDQVYIKGKRVTSFGLRADDAMSFAIPDGIGPGVYRLAFVLQDGSELTWPVAFEITAPFTENNLFEGYEDLGNWSNQPYFGGDGQLAEMGVKVGDLIRIYYKPLAESWQFQIWGGHWESMTFPEYGGTNTVSNENTDPDATFTSFEVTDENIGILTSVAGWGGSLLTQGEGVAITRVTLIQFGAAEKRTPIWEGSTTVGNWDGSMGALSWGGFDWSTVQAGTKLAVSFTPTADDAVMRFGNGSWASMPSLAGLATDGNIPIAGLTSYEFELTDADIAELVNNGGLVICGAYWTITEVDLVTMEGGGPVEETIWEGSVAIGNWDGSMGALSWGGFDWSTVEAGTILCAHYTITDADNGCIRFGNGSWQSIPSLAGLATDGNLPLQEGGHEVELTQADIDELVANGGLVICGAYFTITSVGLK